MFDFELCVGYNSLFIRNIRDAPNSLLVSKSPFFHCMENIESSGDMRASTSSNINATPVPATPSRRLSFFGGAAAAPVAAANCLVQIPYIQVLDFCVLYFSVSSIVVYCRLSFGIVIFIYPMILQLPL